MENNWLNLPHLFKKYDSDEDYKTFLKQKENKFLINFLMKG